MQSRYYSPELLRFICGDGLVSTGQDILGYNMFVYCLNSPVNRYDIDGALSSQIMAEMVIGKRPNIYNYTMEDVIKQSKKEEKQYGGVRAQVNSESFKQSQYDEVDVYVTYIPHGSVKNLYRNESDVVTNILKSLIEGVFIVDDIYEQLQNYSYTKICNMVDYAYDNNLGIIRVDEE